MDLKRKVVLVEDHAVTRIGVKHVVDSSSDFEVIGEADHSSQIPTLLEDAKPDFLLLDLRIPGESSLSQIKVWKIKYPNLKIVILSMVDEPGAVLSAIDSGVDGYLLKSDDLRTLTENLKEIAKGKTIYSESIKQHFTRKSDGTQTTSKEKEILKLLGQGKTYQEIGLEIDLSKRTVEYHVGRLKERFQCKTVAELIGKAKELLLI